ncbi:heme peroxidase, partial [Endogone sp. FLAS-F59071]
MIRSIFLAVMVSAMLAQLARAQNINTTGLPDNLPTANFECHTTSFGSCDFESLFIRTLDGSCNNINHPDWGQAGSYFYRGPEGAQYAPNTTSDPWQTVDSRLISNTIGNDGQPVSPVGSSDGNQVLTHSPINLLGVYFGQWVNHDLEYNKVSTQTSPFANLTNDWLFYCEPPGSNQTNFFNPLNSCFEKSAMSVGDVVNGQLEIINKNNGWVDLSLIYSDNQTQGNVLRTHTDGTLRLRNWDADGGAYANFTTVIQNTLLSQADTNGVVDSDIAALPPMDPQYLMVSGDARASEDIPLTVLHTIFIREHNYQAARYQEIFPNATDEQLFQLARRYTIGEYQKIVYEEYLPVTLGQMLPTYTGYKSTVNPGTSTAFAAGAFRYGHSTARDYDIYDGCSPSGESLLELYDNTDLFSFLNTTISGTRLFFQGQIFVLAGV